MISLGTQESFLRKFESVKIISARVGAHCLACELRMVKILTKKQTTFFAKVGLVISMVCGQWTTKNLHSVSVALLLGSESAVYKCQLLRLFSARSQMPNKINSNSNKFLHQTHFIEYVNENVYCIAVAIYAIAICRMKAYVTSLKLLQGNVRTGSNQSSQVC